MFTLRPVYATLLGLLLCPLTSYAQYSNSVAANHEVLANEILTKAADDQPAPPIPPDGGGGYKGEFGSSALLPPQAPIVRGAYATLAKATSCPAWDADKTYDTAGTVVSYGGVLWRNKWYTKGGQPPGADPWGPWERAPDNAVCGGGDSSDDGGCPAWQAQNYPAAGTLVSHSNKVWRNKWWANSTDVPGQADVWAITPAGTKCGGNSSPTIRLDSPAAGASYAEGTVITLAATASDADGSVAKVEFFLDGASLGTDTSSPYSLNWTAKLGNHTVHAVATDDKGASSTTATTSFSVLSGQNQSPTIALTSPAAGSSFTTGATVTFAANASDADGTVAKVDFFLDGQLLATDSTSPYSATWTATAGSHQFYARATDNAGAATSSQTLTFTVSDNSDYEACPAWEARDYGSAGTMVTHNNNVYRNKWWAGASDTPGSADVWERMPAGTMCKVVPSDELPEPTETVGKHHGAYHTQWSRYAGGDNYSLRYLEDSGAANKLTFINYAFGNVYEDGKCNELFRAETGNGDGGDNVSSYVASTPADKSVDGVADAWDGKLRGNFNQLKKLKKKHPNLKVLISIGGWTWSKNFSKAASTAAGREQLAKSCIDLYIKGNLPISEGAGGPGAAASVFDGIDVDWEYPGGGGLDYNGVSPADKQNFTLLLAELRRQLNELGVQKKRRYYLTAAIGAGIDKIGNTEPGNYIQYLDWVNVMSYDFHGGSWETAGPTNFHSHLYRDPAANETGKMAEYNANSAIGHLIAAGVPAHKIVLGVPFYARGWTGVSPGPDNNGLYQKATGPATSKWDIAVAKAENKPVVATALEPYRFMTSWTGNRFYHPVTKQLWFYDGNVFWSYDDETVIKTKVDYVKNRQLGGIFSWALDNDDRPHTLLKATGTVRD